MRVRVLCPILLVLPLACSSPPFMGEHLDAGDASDAPAEPDSSAEDAPSEAIAPSDAPDDVESDAGDGGEPLDAPAEAALDAGSDPPVDAAADVTQGGDYCPIFGTTYCNSGTEFRTHPANDASVDYNCGAVQPHCPSGWTCWALNSQLQKVSATCP